MGSYCLSKKNEVKLNQKNITNVNKRKSKIIFKETNNVFESTINSLEPDLSPKTNIKTPPKNINKMIVSIDSNVFIAKSSQEPDLVYCRERTLGSGSYGTVYLVKHRKLHKYFAMKVIKKNPNNKINEENLLNEIELLKKMDHPNILKILDFFSLKMEYNIITEFCQEGELLNEIKSKAPFTEELTAYYMREILLAVHYCHNMKIVHRDLKPENILIVKRMKNGFHPIKIIDFGTAKVFTKAKREHLLIGSAYYIAPEVLNKNYNEKCDLWSCGVIMYIMLTGKPPFNGKNEKEIFDKIHKGKFDMESYPWGIISENAKDLIKKLLLIDTKKRLSAEEALKHNWFTIEIIKEMNKINSITEINTIKLIGNLINYRSDNILRCAVIAYLVHNNTQLNQAHDAIKLFNKIDENGDGKISKEELFNGLQSYLASEGDKLKNEVELIFNHIDTDHNGFIEYEEFIRAAIDKEYFLNGDFIKFAFNYFDRDGNGNITLEEVKNLFYQNEKNKTNVKAQEQLQKCFDENDINHDGSLSFEEFVKMMKNIINNVSGEKN